MAEINESVTKTLNRSDSDICNVSDIVDPNCIAEKPIRVTFQDITSASYVIKSGIEYTPCTVNETIKSGNYK